LGRFGSNEGGDGVRSEGDGEDRAQVGTPGQGKKRPLPGASPRLPPPLPPALRSSLTFPQQEEESSFFSRLRELDAVLQAEEEVGRREGGRWGRRLRDGRNQRKGKMPTCSPRLALPPPSTS
jgi:hypothetical protein